MTSSFPGRADQNRPAWMLISARIFSRSQALHELSTLYRGILVPEVSQHLQQTLKNAAANSRLPIESDRRMSIRACNHHLGLASRTVLDGNPIRAKHQHHTSREHYSLSSSNDLIHFTHSNGERSGSGSPSSQSLKSSAIPVNRTSHFEATEKSANPLL